MLVFVNVKSEFYLIWLVREMISEMGNSLAEIRKSTLQMLCTTVQLTQSLPVLPDKCFISMKLLYYEDGKLIYQQTVYNFICLFLGCLSQH
jgi:hypothetical protein